MVEEGVVIGMGSGIKGDILEVDMEWTMMQVMRETMKEAMVEVMVVLVVEWVKVEAREETWTEMTNLKWHKMAGKVEMIPRIREEMTSGALCLISSLKREISLKISEVD